MTRLGRWLTSVALVACLGALVACGDDTSTNPGDAIYGTYSLIEAGGDPVPATLEEQPGYKLELIGGSVRLNDDDTFSFRLQVRETENGAATTQDLVETGTFSRSGSQVNFEGGTAASLSGNRLTMIFENVSLVFEK